MSRCRFAQSLNIHPVSSLATNGLALSLSQANSIVHGACANPACTSGSHDAAFCADPLCSYAHLGPHFAVESDCITCRVRCHSSWRAMGSDVATFLGLDAASVAVHQLQVSAARRHPQPHVSPRALSADVCLRCPCALAVASSALSLCWQVCPSCARFVAASVSTKGRGAGRIFRSVRRGPQRVSSQPRRCSGGPQSGIEVGILRLSALALQLYRL